MGKKLQWRLPEGVSMFFLLLLASVFLLGIIDFQTVMQTKAALFFGICGGYAGLMVLLLLEGVLVGSYSVKTLWEKIRPKTPMQIFLLLYLLFTVVSAVLSKYPQAVWLGATRTEGALTIAIYILCAYWLSKFGKVPRWMIHLFGGASAVFGLLSILQLCGWNPFGLYPAGYNYYDGYKAYSGAYLGTIGNVDLVAAFLCIAIPILWIYLLRGKGKARFWLLLPLAMLLGVLLKMWVLAGLVGIFCGAVVSVAVVCPFGKKAQILYWSLLGGGVIAAVLILYWIDFGGGMLREIHLILQGQASETFGTGRLYIWKSVLNLVPKNLWFGTGPDTMIYANIQPFQRFDESLGMQLVSYIDTAHNEYLNILYHQGVFALVSYLAMLGAAARQWFKSARANLGAAIFGGAVCCYLVQAFFGISQPIATPFFWACLGLLEYYCKREDQPFLKKGGKQ